MYWRRQSLGGMGRAQWGVQLNLFFCREVSYSKLSSRRQHVTSLVGGEGGVGREGLPHAISGQAARHKSLGGEDGVGARGVVGSRIIVFIESKHVQINIQIKSGVLISTC